MSKIDKLSVNIEKIESLAKEKGVKKAFICNAIGTRRGYFTDTKRDNSKIPIDRLVVIADILGTTIEYLTDQTDIKEKPTAQDDELLKEEKELLKLIMKLPKDKKDILQNLAETFLKDEEK